MPARLRAKIERYACVGRASTVAEKMFLGRVVATAGVDEDNDDVVACAELLGLSGTAIDRFFDKCDAKVRRILERDSAGIEALANALLERRWQRRWREVSGDEAMRVITRALTSAARRRGARTRAS